MNKHLIKLHNIAQKEEKIIIGLMSGTSVDGLDIALCKVTGHGGNTKVEVVHFETATYKNDFNIRIYNLW